MNIKQIKSLASILEESNLTLIEVSEGDLKIRMEKAPAEAKVIAAAPVIKEMTEEIPGGVDFNDLNTVTSPMVGVFYSAPAPDMPPFVQIGSKVKKGDVLCIIEAMKLMNDIAADRDGEIIDICAQNGEVVEFGQVLFKIY